jgi:hypothetical protein
MIATQITFPDIFPKFLWWLAAIILVTHLKARGSPTMGMASYQEAAKDTCIMRMIRSLDAYQMGERCRAGTAVSTALLRRTTEESMATT